MLFDCLFHLGLPTGITEPKKNASNQHKTAFTQVVLQIKERTNHCQKKTAASSSTPIPPRLSSLLSRSLPLMHYVQDEHIPIPFLHRKRHWWTCLRQDASFIAGPIPVCRLDRSQPWFWKLAHHLTSWKKTSSGLVDKHQCARRGKGWLALHSRFFPKGSPQIPVLSP